MMIAFKVRKTAAQLNELEAEVLQAAIFLEDTSRMYYQSLGELIQNGNIRRDLQLLAKETVISQNHLKNLLQDPRFGQGVRIRPSSQCPDASGLSMLGIIDAALSSCIQKLQLYKYLYAKAKTTSYAAAIAKAVLRSWREIKFLKAEQKFQKKKESNLNLGLVQGVLV